MLIKNIKFGKNHFLQILFISLGVVSAVFISFYFYQDNYLKKHQELIFKQLDYLKYSIESDSLKLKSICKSYREAKQYRLTLINSSGNVLCDSYIQSNIKSMDNHLLRPEIAGAFREGKFSFVRYSKTLRSELIYGAVLLNYKNEQYVLRQAIPINELNSVYKKIKISIFWVLLPILILLSFSSLYLINYFLKKKEKSVDKMKKDLFYNIAHEVKTPLTSIKGYIQAINLKFRDLDPEVVSLLQRVEGNSARLTKLFDDILNLATIEGTQKLEFEEIDLSSFSTEIIDNLKMSFREKKFDIFLTTEIDSIESDYKYLEYILINLLENAIKYSTSENHIEVNWFEKNNISYLEVKDSGPGISKEAQANIFDRFYRADQSRSHTVAGTGLGLSIVKHAVIKLKGNIELTQSSSSGTSFTVAFNSHS